MTLLFVTRKVDRTDSNAGFIYSWLKKLAEHLDKLIVICQEAGDCSGLGNNIEINSLGKEKGNSKLRQFIKFHSLIISRLPRAQGVFAHMMPIYSILAGPWCRIMKKKLVHWYTHSQVDFKLKLASLFVSQFATASLPSFQLKTQKPIRALGHGIDVGLFAPNPKSHPARGQQHQGFGGRIKFNIISVGRISPTKDYESMIKAVFELSGQGMTHIKLTIIGGPGLESQQSYFDSLSTMVKNMKLDNQVKFLGPIAYLEIPGHLRQADLFINLSGTDSLDKAVLEAMSTGCLVLTSNSAFKNILPEQFLTDRDNPKKLAQKIKNIINLPATDKEILKTKLINEVVAHHNLDNLVKKIIRLFT